MLRSTTELFLHKKIYLTFAHFHFFSLSYILSWVMTEKRPAPYTHTLAAHSHFLFLSKQLMFFLSSHFFSVVMSSSILLSQFPHHFTVTLPISLSFSEGYVLAMFSRSRLNPALFFVLGFYSASPTLLRYIYICRRVCVCVCGPNVYSKMRLYCVLLLLLALNERALALRVELSAAAAATRRVHSAG